MPIPSQTFSSLIALLNYTNANLIPNGMQEINGDALNNVLNGLANFIVKYTVNGSLATVNSSSGSVVIASKPVVIFTGAPTSVQWDDDVQNEYYLSNTTGYDIPLTSGYVYLDQYRDEKTIIPARTTIHIAKAENGYWMLLSSLATGGSGDTLPPQTGNRGKILQTNGSTLQWSTGHWSIVAGTDFSNATECPIEEAADNSLSIFFVDAGNFIYESAGQWEPLAGGGFKILLPSFDAKGAFATARFEVFAKPYTP